MISKEREKLLKKLSEVRGRMELLPSGKVRCTQCKKKDQYYLDGAYAGKNQLPLVQEVIEREYYEELEKGLELLEKKWDDLLTTYQEYSVETIYERQCGGRKKMLKNSICQSVAQKVEQFLQEDYEQGNFREDENEYYTVRGERVRSKSEILIADELLRRNIPYHYEKPLVLRDGNRKVVFRPDFTAMNPRNGKVYIVEHFGLMDNQEYVSVAMRKMNLYEKNGYLLGKNLIIFRESGELQLNRKIVNSYIEEYLL